MLEPIPVETQMWTGYDRNLGWRKFDPNLYLFNYLETQLAETEFASWRGLRALLPFVV